MNRYDPSTPRKRLAVCALAMSALTVALLVGAPAQMSAPRTDAAAVATAQPVPRDPTLVVIEPSRIDVVGVRENVVGVTDPATVFDLQLVARSTVK